MVGVICLVALFAIITAVLLMNTGGPTGAAVAEGSGVCSTLCPSCP